MLTLIPREVDAITEERRWDNGGSTVGNPTALNACNNLRGGRSQPRDTRVPIARSELGKQLGVQQEGVGMPRPDTILRADRKSRAVR
jgi:hypothetical protein